MWGRGSLAWLFCAGLSVASVAGCGGRSTRHQEGGQGGGAGTLAPAGGGGSSAGAGGSLAVTGGLGGTSALLRPCGVVPLSVEQQPPVVILLEASELMAGAAPSGGTHFDLARRVTRALLGTLREGTRVGLAVATDGGVTGACSDPSSLVAPKPLDAAQRRAMEALLDGAAPGGPSALLWAYADVLESLAGHYGGDAPASIVVVGSGSTAADVTCGVATAAWLIPELEGAVAAANANGKDTFAVGMVGTMEERRILSALAIAGGTAPPECGGRDPSSCYFDLVDGSDVRLGLERALRASAVLSPSVCQLELASIPADRALEPDLLTFRLGADGKFSIVERVEPGACSTGWQLSEDGSKVVLCPETCGAFRTDPNVTLEIALACDGPPPRN